MNGIVELQIWQFLSVYLLLFVVLGIFLKMKLNQTKKLLLSSVMMTIQLIAAGFVLTFIFERPHPAFTIIYLSAMLVFASYQVVSKNRKLNRKFKISIVLSLWSSGTLVLAMFVGVIVGVSIFNPQYTIPLGGMIIGNAMTGINLGMKTFTESIATQRNKLENLLNLGVDPKRILLPHVNQALETALMPTINSMMGMGIIFLPGMMTGQILSGTNPTTAILYQIAIMIAICSTVCLAVFGALIFGYRTLYNSRKQFVSFLQES
ncbi:MAG TPA: ABC transporter permease [Clostridiaceae bacterium]|jgi:putative ABC transport system permease protein|nr:ABC transporter permease [Clostridiaceae bacterium]